MSKRKDNQIAMNIDNLLLGIGIGLSVGMFILILVF